MKHAFLMLFIVAGFSMAGCGNSPTAPRPFKLSVTLPLAGQTFAIGDLVTVGWACIGCDMLGADTGVEIAVVNEPAGVVTVMGPNGSYFANVPWFAGQTPAGLLKPGLYHIRVQTFPDHAVTANGPSFLLIAAK